MSENDYIAEYVKERHPRILGVDYAFWKLGKMAENAMQKVADTFLSIDWGEIAEEDDDEEDDDE